MVKVAIKNLEALESTLDYNFKHNIKFYRCSDNLFPFIANRKFRGHLGKVLWLTYRSLRPFEEKLKQIGKKLFVYGIRLTF
jgi:UV DNA damage repair endonuclease